MLVAVTLAPTQAIAFFPRVPSTILRDVTYCVTDGVRLRMDLYFPERSPEDILPLLLYVHGGAWIGGDKTQGAGTLDIAEFLRRGYVIAAVNYRLGPEYPFPAQIEDVKCAIRSLRAKALSYHIDPGRFGAWGGSAGGQLVSLLGLSHQNSGFDIGQFTEQSSRVNVVVDYYGIVLLTTDYYGLTHDFYAHHANLLRRVFKSEDLAERASPVNYVSKDSPSFLIIHGDCDEIVPLNQSQLLYSKLLAAGAQARLLVIKNAGHDFVPTCGPISPGRATVTKIVADFFDQYLRTVPNSPSIVFPGVVALIFSVAVLDNRRNRAPF